MLYSEKVMDHFRNPRNVGSIENADGVGEVGNAKCGDIMKIYLKIDDNVVSDVKFETFGCGSAIASSSMATEMIKGKPLDEVMELTNKAVVQALDGLPAHKLHCSVLAEEAVKSALKDYYDKKRHRIRPQAVPGSQLRELPLSRRKPGPSRQEGPGFLPGGCPPTWLSLWESWIRPKGED